MKHCIILVSLVALLFACTRSARAAPQDRQVAEWVMLLSRAVRQECMTGRIREVTVLPSVDYHLELIDLVGTYILPPDLKWLTGLTRLKVLNLPGPMWNPSSGATIDYSKNLGHIAHLP